MLHRLCIFCIAIFFSLQVYSQQCGNCKVTPVIATYDFEIRVPQVKPGSEGWLEYLQLYWLASHANSYLFKMHSNCARFVMAPEKGDALDDDYDIEKIGIMNVRLPHPDYKENYITTGNVTKSGNDYILHLELLSACSRKMIASADVPFKPSTSSSYIRGIAQTAAEKLNLIKNINAYELEERKRNVSFALGGLDRDLIKLTPAKRKLEKGETTTIGIELKDCDGEPLAGRWIIFDSDEGMQIKGTIGGTVTPSKIVTDANGKASVSFKMTAGEGSPAIVNAYSPTVTSLNCKDAFIGSVQLDAATAVKIVINYFKTGNEAVGMDSKEDNVVFKADNQLHWTVRYMMIVYHYPPSSTIDNKHVVIVSDDTKDGKPELVMHLDNNFNSDNIPQFPAFLSTSSTMGKSIFYSAGTSEQRTSDQRTHMKSSPLGAEWPPAVETKNVISYFPVMPTVSFMIKNNELVFFSSGVDYAHGDEEESPMPGGFGIELGNKKYFPVKAQKITDPTSPYKSKYVLTYNESTVTRKDGTISYTFGDYERATVTIYTPF